MYAYMHVGLFALVASLPHECTFTNTVGQVCIVFSLVKRLFSVKREMFKNISGYS